MQETLAAMAALVVLVVPVVLAVAVVERQAKIRRRRPLSDTFDHHPTLLSPCI